MKEATTRHLQECFARYRSSVHGLAELENQWQRLSPSLDADAGDILNIYDKVYPLLEKALWSGDAEFHPLLECYQSLFREQEALIHLHNQNERSKDDRYHFILSIPVADRPPHLRACLESIYQVCKQFNYGGKTSGVWGKIRIIVAEDSQEQTNIHRHRELINQYAQKGLQVIHFDQAEQYELLHSLPRHQREHLGTLLTTQPKERFYLKGQAANRNLSYLKSLQLTEDKDKTLYYFIDSDESLCVNRLSNAGEEVVVALNYFYYIDKLFRTNDIHMLTGKMVGDPPVSPAVMAANFLDDIIAFFNTLSELDGDQTCQFHGPPARRAGDAAYHDMAKLFGYNIKPETFPYQCRLEGDHDHADCLRDVAKRLNDFFFGEHLTRKTWFNYGGGFSVLAPARTIYPGNYVVDYEGLKYIIPFGHLRLRMSGPTAGRLIAAEIGERFASFNMPNLHRRTTEAGLSKDFRPGVALERERIDISNEFERQFFGDLMLFSTEVLVKRADVNAPFEKDLLEEIVNTKERELLELYQQKHEAIMDRNQQMDALVFNAGHWWLSSTALADTLRRVRDFIGNIDHNFGEHALAWRQIQSSDHRAQRKQQIIEALMRYRAERDVWDSLF